MNYENLKTIEIEGKEYHVLVCESDSDRSIGLSETSDLQNDEGCLFLFPELIKASDCVFTMEDMDYNLDIIYVNPENTVVSVINAEAGDANPILPDCDPNTDIAYVIELNSNSGVLPDDEVDLDSDSDEEGNEELVLSSDKMYILGSDGKPQGEIEAGARIFSRIHSKQIIKKAKKANRTKEDKDYKRLGKLMFKILDKQDNQENQYVEAPKGSQENQ